MCGARANDDSVRACHGFAIFMCTKWLLNMWQCKWREVTNIALAHSKHGVQQQHPLCTHMLAERGTHC